jgi:hypothetical protein
MCGKKYGKSANDPKQAPADSIPAELLEFADWNLLNSLRRARVDQVETLLGARSFVGG